MNDFVYRGGIKLQAALDKFKIVDIMDSPILGGAGNQEYLLFLEQK